jgi:hypothetical protein
VCLRLVDREHGAGSIRQLAVGRVEAGIGQNKRRVPQGGLGEHQGDLATGEGSFECLDVVERHDQGALQVARRDPEILGLDVLAVEQPQRHIEVPVVLAVEDEHLLPARREPRQANDLEVRLAGRERELPERNPEAGTKLLGDRNRVLGRKLKDRPPAHSGGHRRDDRFRSVSTERGGDRKVEVAVRPAVDVREGGSLSLGDEDRRMVVQKLHPGHGNAKRHRAPGPFEELQRAGVLAREAGILAFLQAPRALEIDTVRGRRHGARRKAGITSS